MASLRKTILDEFDLYLDRFELALARLDDERVWTRPGPGMNSVGNLVLHVEGNIRTFLGQEVGGVPYERDRRAEFEASGGRSVEELRGVITATRELARRVVTEASDASLDEPSTSEEAWTKRDLVLHVVAHAGYHAGQAVLLAKLVSGDGGQMLAWGH